MTEFNEKFIKKIDEMQTSREKVKIVEKVVNC